MTHRRKVDLAPRQRLCIAAPSPDALTPGPSRVTLRPMTHLVRLALLVATLHLVACADEFTSERLGSAEAGASAAGSTAAGGETAAGGTGGGGVASGGATATGGSASGGDGGAAAGAGGVASGGEGPGGAGASSGGTSGGAGGMVFSPCANWGPARDPMTGNGWAIPGGLYVEGGFLWKFVGPGDGVIGWNCAPTNPVREVYCKTWWEKVDEC